MCILTKKGTATYIGNYILFLFTVDFFFMGWIHIIFDNTIVAIPWPIINSPRVFVFVWAGLAFGTSPFRIRL